MILNLLLWGLAVVFVGWMTIIFAVNASLCILSLICTGKFIPYDMKWWEYLYTTILIGITLPFDLIRDYR